MEIRLLQATDAEAAVALRRLALTTDGYAFAERLESDPALNVEFVRQRLADNSVAVGAVVVGVFDPELVGVVGVSRINTDSDGARLWGFYVHPDRRRNGLGLALIDHAVRCARQMAGVRRVDLSVVETAVSAIRLYDAAGFVTRGTMDGRQRMTLQIG
jgi:ribosomal protein S18 acetylase RimI-like enzyme